MFDQFKTPRARGSAIVASLLLACNLGPELSAQWIDKRVTVQPIHVSDGTEIANAAHEYFTQETNRIWAQAGIEIVFLSPIDWTGVEAEVYADVSSNNAAPNSLLGLSGVNNGLWPTQNSTTLRMWFVHSIDNHAGTYGFALQSTVVDTLGGPNFLPSNGIAIAENVFTHASGQGFRQAIAHEIGHNLGLGHSDLGASGQFNLMSGTTAATSLDDIYFEGSGYGALTAAQIERARFADFAIDLVSLGESPYMYSPVPEPSEYAVIIGAIALFSTWRRRAKGALRPQRAFRLL